MYISMPLSYLDVKYTLTICVSLKDVRLTERRRQLEIADELTREQEYFSTHLISVDSSPKRNNRCTCESAEAQKEKIERELYKYRQRK